MEFIEARLMLTASKLATKYAIAAGAAILLPACASVQKTTAAAGVGSGDGARGGGVSAAAASVLRGRWPGWVDGGNE